MLAADGSCYTQPAIFSPAVFSGLGHAEAASLHAALADTSDWGSLDPESVAHWARRLMGGAYDVGSADSLTTLAWEDVVSLMGVPSETLIAANVSGVPECDAYGVHPVAQLAAELADGCRHQLSLGQVYLYALFTTISLSVGEVYEPSSIGTMAYVMVTLFISVCPPLRPPSPSAPPPTQSIHPSAHPVHPPLRPPSPATPSVVPLPHAHGCLLSFMRADGRSASVSASPAARRVSCAWMHAAPRQVYFESFVIGTVVNVVEHLDEVNKAHRGRMLQVQLFLRMRKVDRSTQRKILTFLDHTWRMHGGTIPDTQQLLEQVILFLTHTLGTRRHAGWSMLACERDRRPDSHGHIPSVRTLTSACVPPRAQPSTPVAQASAGGARQIRRP